MCDEEVFEALGHAPSGFVEAPAGCGKTEAIVRSVEQYCTGRQLILTHTHAGVDALRQRFLQRQVPGSRYHIDTIAGWSWGWVRRYPANAGYTGSRHVAQWNAVYPAMVRLLGRDFVRQGVLNSYSGVIVDEYQDCTVPMHELIVALGELLPCRILGDDLQGIFDFADPLVSWSDVQSAFRTDLGTLETPHRWINAGNERLGYWLQGIRDCLRRGGEPQYRNSPVDRRRIHVSQLSGTLVRLTHEKEGRICVIGPKARDLPSALQTTLVRHKYRILEPNDLKALRELVEKFEGASGARRPKAVITFLKNAYGGIPQSEKTFIEKLLRGERQSPRREDKVNLSRKHTEGYTPELLLDLLSYLESQDTINIRLHESSSALKCILEEHIRTKRPLADLYADEIARRKYQRRGGVFRCAGKTLLVKGLQFDHVVIVRNQNWGTFRDLYVALTRGSQSVTLLEQQG